MRKNKLTPLEGENKTTARQELSRTALAVKVAIYIKDRVLANFDNIHILCDSEIAVHHLKSNNEQPNVFATEEYKNFCKDALDIMIAMISRETNEDFKKIDQEILKTSGIPPGQNLSALNYRIGLLELGSEWIPEELDFNHTKSKILK